MELLITFPLKRSSVTCFRNSPRLHNSNIFDNDREVYGVMEAIFLPSRRQMRCSGLVVIANEHCLWSVLHVALVK
jgi:hypothetical protein